MQLNYMSEVGAVYLAAEDNRRFFQLHNEEERKSHFSLDSHLIDALEVAIEPYLGSSDASSARWFHSLDTHGNGVRLIEAEVGYLTATIVGAIQGVLQGPYQHFVVLWKAYSTFPPTPKASVEAALIGSSEIVATIGIGL